MTTSCTPTAEARCTQASTVAMQSSTSASSVTDPSTNSTDPPRVWVRREAPAGRRVLLGPDDRSVEVLEPARAQVVEHQDVVASCRQRVDEVRANEPRTSRYQVAHLLYLLRLCRLRSPPCETTERSRKLTRRSMLVSGPVADSLHEMPDSESTTTSISSPGRDQAGPDRAEPVQRAPDHRPHEHRRARLPREPAQRPHGSRALFHPTGPRRARSRRGLIRRSGRAVRAASSSDPDAQTAACGRSPTSERWSSSSASCAGSGPTSSTPTPRRPAPWAGSRLGLAGKPRPLVVHTYHGHVLEGHFGPAATVGLPLHRAPAGGESATAWSGSAQATVDDLVRLRIAPREAFRGRPPRSRPRQRFDDVTRADGARLPRAGRRRRGRCPADLRLPARPAQAGRLLIRALAQLRPTHPNLRLAVVGDGEHRPALEALTAELGLQEAVTFVGYMPRRGSRRRRRPTWRS